MNANTTTTTESTYVYADGKSVPYKLTRSQRADCCSSRAIFEVTFDFGVLYFCNHHYNKHKLSIILNNVTIVDESSILVK